MIREIIRPKSQEYTVRLPKEYLNREVEILILPFFRDSRAEPSEVDETKAFSSHSAGLVEEWLDEREDEIWK